VTDDGQFVNLVRFESEDAARRKSNRPEQDQWWAETSRLFDGEVTFRESTEVDLDIQGDPDRAGFVQIIEGRTHDPARARELMAQNPEQWAAFRSDILAAWASGTTAGSTRWCSTSPPRKRRARGNAGTCRRS
jgi:hypothetical protein